MFKMTAVKINYPQVKR